MGLFSQLCPKDMEVCNPHISDGWGFDASRGNMFFGGKMVVNGLKFPLVLVGLPLTNHVY